MKKTTTGRGPSHPGFGKPLQIAIRLMGENLVAWRRTPVSSPTKRQQYLDSFLVAARDGYRQMALKLIRGRKRVDELDQLITSGQLDESDAVEDWAQLCVLSLVKIAGDVQPKAPFVPAKIDKLLAEAKCKGLPETGTGAPISAYLHGVLFRTVAKKISVTVKKAKKLRVASENLVHQADFLNLTVSDRRLGTDIGSVRIKVSLRQNVELARKIQDDYLDNQFYKGRPLRGLLGNWTPLDEWIENCDITDRPKSDVIKEETLRNHINDIRELITLEKNRLRELSEESHGSSLWVEENGDQS